MTAGGPPLSRPVAVADVPQDGLDLEIVATEAERAAVSALNETVAVERLVARIRMKPFGVAGLAVSGLVEADARRTCVVSLDDFIEHVREPVALRFVPGRVERPGDVPNELELSSADEPDPYFDGVLDVGAVVSEFFTLGLDAYPRKPGARLALPEATDEAPSPFSALAKLVRSDD